MDDIRAACDAAVRVVATARPDLIVVVGGTDTGDPAAYGDPAASGDTGGDADPGPGLAAEFGAGAAGSLAGFGVDWTTGTGEPVLPLSLTIGRWLLERGGLPGPGTRVVFRPVPFDAPPARCLALGAQLADRTRRVAMLVTGDGSARRTTKAPGYLDPRALSYDAEVAAALASADPARLAPLDPALSAELMAAGRAAWQVLAGAAVGGQFRGRLLLLAAPYGVGYHVASWTRISQYTLGPWPDE